MTPHDYDDQLDRLLQAAGRAARESGLVSAAPFGLETRVLAAWREAGVQPEGIWSMAILLRGLVAACAVMLLCLWPALSATSTTPDSDSLQLADSTLQVDNL